MKGRKEAWKEEGKIRVENTKGEGKGGKFARRGYALRKLRWSRIVGAVFGRYTNTMRLG